MSHTRFALDNKLQILFDNQTLQESVGLRQNTQLAKIREHVGFHSITTKYPVFSEEISDLYEPFQTNNRPWFSTLPDKSDNISYQTLMAEYVIPKVDIN